ncbi:MAG: IS630 family transposase [Candidatus Rokubacteria bacterium]|nr:IS630 family transposase [Candidatus Rokubacteria bacterium]
MAPGKNNAARLGAHLVFVDESGFLLIPSVRKTWAPRGQTPVLRIWQRRDKLSVISGVSVSPRRRRYGLYYRVQTSNIRRPDVCAFLRHLLRHLRGAVIVLWDNGRIHKGPPIEALRHAFPRLHLEFFPAYAPKLNPDEGVWTLAKGTLANGRPDCIATLKTHLVRSLKSVRHSQRRLRGCITQSDLPSFFALSVALFMQ